MSHDNYQEALRRISDAANENRNKLTLSDLGLTKLPPELMELQNLEFLYLQANQLNDLPASLGRLTNLRELYLHNNRLRSIPAELSQLVALKKLYLHSNLLEAIPDELGRLIGLETLWLNGNQLRAIPIAICELVKLHTLKLCSNNLRAIPVDLGRLANLQTLYLYGNNLTAVPPDVGQLNNLQTLYLHNNQLREIPPEFGRLRNLKTLSLHRNELCAIPAELGQLTCLQMFYLQSNKLGALPPELGELINLQILDLSANQLRSIPSELGRLTNLQKLLLHANQLNVIPSEVGRLNNLHTLSLSNNGLTTIPSEVGQLANLQALYLNDNRLSAVPVELGTLTKLRKLNLHNNNLEALPAELGRLANLNSLYVNNNQLVSVPKELGRLEKLRALNLNRNQLDAVPSELGQLINLRMLDLHGNRLTAAPTELGRLVNLQTLQLNWNQLTSIPVEFGELTNLQTLYLSHNQLNAIPAELGMLAKLYALYLHANNLDKIPSDLGHLNNLRTLRIDANRLRELPAELEKLTNLKTLNLYGNQLTTISPNLGQLTNLEFLDLSRNHLDAIPAEPGNLKRLKGLYLHQNAALRLPRELLGPTELEVATSKRSPASPSEILEYYARVKANGRHLNEAKLILVGIGGVGKSSLAERLIYGTFYPGKAKTEGISIDQWKLNIADEEVRLNVWDFGGQEIMHATHQFFLTERSIYLVVLNGREGKEDIEAEYWMKLITSFGADSPVIIVLNKTREHAFDLNRRALLAKYPNVRGFVRTDCGDDTGIEELHALIVKETDLLDELRVKFPGEWFTVKDALAAPGKNFLSFTEYRKLCEEQGVDNHKHQEMLARYLNQLGIVLNYRNDPRLKDTHILNPHWVTNGIYKILNSPLLRENEGEITLAEITGILPDTEYPSSICRFIFDLMKKFDLCFTYPDDDLHYLIPELLPKNEPEATREFIPENCLNFQYHYPVLPEGLLPRFITRSHHMSIGEPSWRSGAIVRFENCRALVKADVVDRRVIISVMGENAENRRRLLAIIRADFERIHREIKNLNPEEKVPLPGLPKQIVSYADLLAMEKEGLKEYPVVVNGKVTFHIITDLLNGVDFPRVEEAQKESGGIKVFFSYAHKDEAFRVELENHLKILQRQNVISGWSDREIQVAEGWREEIGAQLEKAEIILLLISSDFFASEFCYEVEMKRAMERHENGDCQVIPIIIRDYNWKTAPFGKLQALPKDGKAITLWSDRDNAWRTVSEGIEKAADSLRIRKS